MVCQQTTRSIVTKGWVEGANFAIKGIGQP